jgi:hypothetical protein
MKKEKRHAFLVGLDVQSNHYPVPEHLPENITLGILDAIAEDVPVEHIGVYDVVHIRAFGSVVREDNPVPVIKNAYKMLKPGGYIQWDDMDGDSFKAVAPGSNPKDLNISTVATEDMVATAMQFYKSGANLKYSWLRRLRSLFEQEGFEVVDEQRMDVKKELRSVMTITLLMIHAHVARVAVRNGRLVGTEKNWEDVWTKAGKEIAQGVSLTMDMIVAVGRKRT